MNVLIACEFSGIVRDAFIARGHDAVSCDLLPTERPGPHIQGDVLDIIDDPSWDLMIAHPPCTRLANSGVRWLAERNLWDEMREGALFFKRFLDADIPRIAVENPIMHKYAIEVIGRKHDCTVQPWQFGHRRTKRTCFWLKGLPPLKSTDVVEGPYEQYSANLPPSKDRWKLRSTTEQGIADAMAEQWGSRHKRRGK